MRRARLLSLVAPSCVAAALAVHDKRELFAHLAAVFAQELDETDAAAIEAALWEREKAQVTAVGHATAIPHATLDSVERTIVGLVTLDVALDYGAPDGAPVRCVFASVGPPADRQTHLEILAGISRLLLRTDVLERLAVARTPNDVMAALRDAAAPRAGSPPGSG